MLAKLLNVLAVITARTDRPQPVMKRAQVAAAMQSIAAVLACFGIDLSNNAIEWAIKGVMFAGVAATLVAAFHGEKLVTPSDDPQDAAGTPLEPVPAGHVVVHQDVAARGIGAAVNDAVGATADVAIDQTSALGHAVGGITDVARDLVGGVYGLLGKHRADTTDENPAHVERAVQDPGVNQ